MSTQRLRSDLGEGLLEHVRALASAEGDFAAVVAAAPVALYVSSREGGYEYVNGRWCELAGIEAAAARGAGWQNAVHPDDLPALLAERARPSASCEYRFLHRDGTVRFVESRSAELRKGGELLGHVGVCIELDRRGAAAAEPGDEERFRLAFDRAPIATALVGREGELVEVNVAFCELTGYPRAELLTLSLGDLTVPGDAAVSGDRDGEAHGELRYRRADGTALWVATSASTLRGPDGEPLTTILQVEDIGERKQAERELRQLADHDALTGLLNRRGFMDGLHRELRRMDRRGEYGALLVLDLDNFKLVNDTAGHMAGDQVLRTTADVLRRRLRATDVIGRLGGDEFAALVLNVTPRQAREIADETADALRSLTVTAGEETIKVDASIGVVAIDEMRADNEDDLLAAADRAMYRAKLLRREAELRRPD